jgi:hypothetical protein
VINGCRDLNKNGQIDLYENWRLPPAQRVADLMGRMTTEEKVQQLFYTGSVVFTEGFYFSPGIYNDQIIAQKGAAATRLGISVGSLGDNVHGFRTAYPSSVGLSAGRDVDMVYRCANMQRIEHRRAGHAGTLAPIAEFNTTISNRFLKFHFVSLISTNHVGVRCYELTVFNQPQMSENFLKKFEEAMRMNSITFPQTPTVLKMGPHDRCFLSRLQIGYYKYFTSLFYNKI